MKKLVCQMGMICCMLGMMLVVGGWIEGMHSFWASACAVCLLLAAQRGLAYAAEHPLHRSRARRRSVAARLPAEKKSRLRAA